MDLNSSRVLLGAAGAGGASSPYWFNILSSPGFDQGTKIAVDSQNNIYAVGRGNGTGFVVKLDPFGTVQWQRDYPATLQGVDTDSSGNIYAVGIIDANGYLCVVKYDPSGTLLWQRSWNIANAFSGPFGIAIAPGDVIAIGGAYRNTSNDIQAFFARVSSTGTLSSTSANDATSGANRIHALAWSPFVSRFIGPGIISGEAGGGSFDCYLAGITTSGGYTTARSYLGSATSNNFFDAAGNSNGTWVVGTVSSPETSGGLSDMVTARLDSINNISWQRFLGAGAFDEGKGIAVDSTDNVYCVGSTQSGSIIAKYNGEGTLLWQRFFSGGLLSVTLDGNGDVCITGSASNGLLVLKIPPDGSLTGTYGTINYTVSSLTTGTSTLTTGQNINGSSNFVSPTALTPTNASNPSSLTSVLTSL